ncbi:MAG: 5-(carboxyamino)imidazole ribonucleotide synthase [Actinomycetota bacterium]
MAEQSAASGPLPPGSTIGILGGGQLGRMISVAASRLGLQCHIFEPDAEPPAGQVAAAVTTAPYDDVDAVRAFAAAVDVVTFEFENVPASTLDLIEDQVAIHPTRRALAVSQDRLDEKAYISSLGIPVADHAEVSSRSDLAAAVSSTGGPGIVKTRRFGYDGKGQVRIGSAPTDGEIDEAWAELKGAPAIFEAMVPFTQEISVIVARSAAGEVVCFDPGVNVHRHGILHTTTVNGSLPPETVTAAIDIATRIVDALSYVGVMGVELFDTDSGLLVNEIAPRVHNSGHWTTEACVVDQFQQHVRAIAGWPLGDGSRHSDAVMTNLIGDEIDAWPHLAAEPGVGVHLYGKGASRPGRKMGHVTQISLRH